MRAAISSAARSAGSAGARSGSAAACSRGRSRRRGARRRRVAFGHGADQLAGVRVVHLDDALARRPARRRCASIRAATRARMALQSSFMFMAAPAMWLQREVEGVEVAPAARGRRSASVRLAISGTRCSERPPCERSGTSSAGQVVARRGWCRARVSRSETTTRSPMRSGGSSKRAQPPRRASARRRCRAARRCARHDVARRRRRSAGRPWRTSRARRGGRRRGR